jgi:phosphatidate cytidylyltransferase
MDSGKPSIPLSATTSTPSARNLWLRVASAAILAPLAIGAAWFGDWPFTIFWGLAAIAVWWEWIGLVEPSGRNVVLATGVCALALQGVVLEAGTYSIALMILALGVVAVIVTAGRQAAMIVAGLIYASALLMATVILRADAKFGFAVIVLLFAIVWGTDIGGFFAGRAIGGPKLAPAVSPKKTWSGAIGGAIVGVAAAIAVGEIFSIRNPVMIGIVALFLSAVSQSGDLFESWLKRRFDAKDTSTLIPGHGGVMDRLDGFIFASVAAALIGIMRGGLDAPAAGLLVR